jgi:hypothetical protein
MQSKDFDCVVWKFFVSQEEKKTKLRQQKINRNFRRGDAFELEVLLEPGSQANPMREACFYGCMHRRWLLCFPKDDLKLCFPKDDRRSDVSQTIV